MARCPYCGRSAGFFKRAHAECTAQHQKSAQTVIAALDGGKLPSTSISGTNPIRLQKNEQVIWNFVLTRHFKFKRHSSHTGSSRGVSFRVAKGVYYRAGTHRGHSVSDIHLDLVDTGDLAVCSQNLYFIGRGEAVRIPYNKIIATTLLSDGIEVFKEGRAAPFVFRLNDPHFAANLLARLPLENLTAAANDE